MQGNGKHPRERARGSVNRSERATESSIACMRETSGQSMTAPAGNLARHELRKSTCGFVGGVGQTRRSNHGASVKPSSVAVGQTHCHVCRWRRSNPQVTWGGKGLAGSEASALHVLGAAICQPTLPAPNMLKGSGSLKASTTWLGLRPPLYVSLELSCHQSTNPANSQHVKRVRITKKSTTPGQQEHPEGPTARYRALGVSSTE